MERRTDGERLSAPGQQTHSTRGTHSLSEPGSMVVQAAVTPSRSRRLLFKLPVATLRRNSEERVRRRETRKETRKHIERERKRDGMGRDCPCLCVAFVCVCVHSEIIGPNSTSLCHSYGSIKGTSFLSLEIMNNYLSTRTFCRKVN